jgi:hypothetical protein
VDPGVPGLESKTDGRIAPVLREIPRKTTHFAEKRLFYATNSHRTAHKRPFPG